MTWTHFEKEGVSPNGREIARGLYLPTEEGRGQNDLSFMLLCPLPTLLPPCFAPLLAPCSYRDFVLNKLGNSVTKGSPPDTAERNASI